MRQLGIGIDCDKNTQTVYISDNMGRHYGSTFVTHNKVEDVELLVGKVVEIENKLGEKVDVVINMESTSVYHLPMYSTLSKIFHVNLYQPAQVKEETKKGIRKTKTNKRDAKILSTLHLQLQPSETDYSDKEMYDVREIVRLRYKYQDIRTNMKKRFRRNLQIVFPGFDTLFKDPYKDGAWALLKVCPTPEDVLRLGEDKIAAILLSATNGQSGSKKSKELVKLANETIRCDIFDRGALFGLKILMEDIEYFNKRIEHIESEIKVYWEKIKQTLYFPSHPGINEIQATALHCEFGGFDRFPEGDMAVAFSGTENFVYISGNTKFNGSMTKAGSRTIRRVLWEIISPPKKYIPRITEHMKKLLGRGEHRSVRIHSASKKLIRRLWALEHKEQLFNPGKITTGQPC